MNQLRCKLTYANVMSTIAVFLVIGGGTAYAAKQILPKNSVGAKQIKKGAITGAKIKNGAVGAGALAGGAVTAGKLAAGAVASADISPGAVTSGAIANQAVGTSKISAGAVSNGALANNAVTSAKVQDGSLTGADVAPNTFLAAGGTAADSTHLDGLGPTDFVRGKGRLMSARTIVPAGGSAEILDFDFAHIEGTCPGSVPTQSLFADLPNLENAIYTAIDSGASSTAPGTTDVQTANSLAAGSSLTATHTTTSPQSVTWQAAYNDGSEEVATAWISGQDEAGSCVFIAQGTTTLG